MSCEASQTLFALSNTRCRIVIPTTRHLTLLNGRPIGHVVISERRDLCALVRDVPQEIGLALRANLDVMTQGYRFTELSKGHANRLAFL